MTHPTSLLANHCIDAIAVPLTYRELRSDKVIAGNPRVGIAELGTLGGLGIGVWELSPSVSTDIEVDEFFIVLSGEAVVDFDDGSPPLHLSAGTVGRLSAGSATRWTVTQTLRKIYIA